MYVVLTVVYVVLTVMMYGSGGSDNGDDGSGGSDNDDDGATLVVALCSQT